MAQWFLTLVAFAENLGSIPSTHLMTHSLQLQEMQCPLWPLRALGTRYTKTNLKINTI